MAKAISYPPLQTISWNPNSAIIHTIQMTNHSFDFYLNQYAAVYLGRIVFLMLPNISGQANPIWNVISVTQFS